MATIKALYIPSDLDEAVEQVTFDSGDLHTMQKFVGGYVEPIDGDEDHPISIWVDEDGISKSRDVNRRATLLLYAVNPATIDRHVLLGDALVTGLPDDVEGDTQSVTDELLELVFNHPIYQIEVQAPGPAWNTNQARYASYWDALEAAYSLACRWSLVTAFRASAT